MKEENRYKGRKLGSKNKATAEIKEAIQMIVDENLPKVMSRLDEMSVKDQANTIIQLVKFVVPTMKSQELAVTELPEGKINPLDEDVLKQIVKTLDKPNNND